MELVFILLGSNSQILATSNFSTNHDIFPWIGEKLHYGAELQQFSRKNMSVRMPGKLSEIHSKVLVFSNPGDNIQLLVKLWDTFVPLFLHILRPCLQDWRTMGLWNVVLTVCPGTLVNLLFLENSWNSALMCSFSPIQGTMS